tara:strand:+ start:259 stop:438 length:180 start_codon:yes stop_codon:yes gene_type:complete
MAGIENTESEKGIVIIGDNKDIEGNEGLLLGELYLKFLVIEREIYYRSSLFIPRYSPHH